MRSCPEIRDGQLDLCLQFSMHTRIQPSGFSDVRAPETALPLDAPRVAAEAHMWFEFNSFLLVGFPSLLLLCPAPSLFSRRYSWTFQPGKKFLNIMVNGR